MKMMLYFGSVMLPAESAFTRGDDSDRFHDDFHNDLLINSTTLIASPTILN